MRHSERLDYANPLYWLVCLGYYRHDPPLTKRGCDMAEDKAKDMITEHFDPTRIFSSPYLRTTTTASIINKYYPEATLSFDTGLSEYQIWSRHCTSMYPDGIDHPDYPFPETYEQLKHRTINTIEGIIKSHPGEDILIVTHGAVLRAYIDHINSIIETYKPATPLIETGDLHYLSTLSFSKSGAKITDIVLN